MNPVRLRYQTYEFGDFDIHIRSLKNKQQFSDPFGEADAIGISSAQWPLFGVIWESSEILARELLTFDIKGKRMLEVGCGMALTSLMLNQRQANITATDYHPEVASFLIENVKLNNGNTIPFLRTSWADLTDGLGTFDVIVGADLLYEKQHTGLLSEFIDRHASPQCQVIIVNPHRGHNAEFSKKMIALGYTLNKQKTAHTDPQTPPFKGVKLQYSRI